jgi:prepilin-type N-terminal cleavage/methylation domain-containing protein
VNTASIGHARYWHDTESANGLEGFSLLEMMMVVTLILIVAYIAAPTEALSPQPSAFSESADN